MNTDTRCHGNYYLKRAIIAQLGLGANLPEDALNLGDETGKPLDGGNAYVLHFDKARRPQWMRSGRSRCMIVMASRWPNSLNGFAVSSWMSFKYDADGSLDLILPERQSRC